MTRKEFIRHDTSRISDKFKSDEGFIKLKATVTRTGVFSYLKADGSVLRELRHPDDVFNEDSLKSLEMLPVTLHHPKERVVTSDNFKKLAVGYTGEKVKHDSRLIHTVVKITDKNAISAIEDQGIKELSLGYNVTLVDEAGEYNGERYDARQTKIKYNHLALVDKGRAGPEAKIHLDSGDAIQQQEKNIIQKFNQTKEKKMDLIKIDVGGLKYDAAPEVENELNKVRKDAADKAAAIDVLTTEKTGLQAKLDEANEKVAELQKADSAENISKAVQARIGLEREALRHLDKDTKLDSLSDLEIKKACIAKCFPAAKEKLDSADDAYVNARFDSVIEIEYKQEPKQPIAVQRQAMVNKNNNDDKDVVKMDADSARKRMIETLTTSWKSESK